MNKKKKKERPEQEAKNTSIILVETNKVDMKEKEPVNDDKKNRRIRIVDLLDLQLLLAVIVFFVSGWAYLHSVICGFSGSEPYNERMGYILVHYILTTVLVLCIYITYIKSKYLFLNKSEESYEKLWVDFFVNSWIIFLVSCLGILLLTQNISSYVPSIIVQYVWVVAAIAFLLVVATTMKKHGFSPSTIKQTCISLVVFFPFFISAMMSVSKNIEVKVERNRDSFYDQMNIIVDARGYDCQYVVEGIADSRLIKNFDYTVDGAVIRTISNYFPNNKVTVSIVSPAVDDNNLMYALRKIFRSSEPLNKKRVEDRKKYYKSVIFSYGNNE